MKILLWEKSYWPSLKLLKMYQVTTKEERQTFPSNVRQNKIMTLIQINRIRRQLILLKIPTNNTRSNDIHCETTKNFAPLFMKNKYDFPTCKSVNITSFNSTKSHQMPLFSNNGKTVSDFVRKRRLDLCVTENYIKNFIPGNSNYASIVKNGPKILVVDNNHVKRIRKID